MKEITKEYQLETITDKAAIKIRRQEAKRRLETFLAKPGPKRALRNTEPAVKRQFLRIPFELLDNADYLEFMAKKKFRTYMYLQRHIVRAFQLRASVDLYHEFFLFRNELAAGIPLSKIAKDLQISKSTARDHIRDLEKDGLLQTHEIDACESNDGHQHNVYVMGTHHGDIESLFIDEVFGKGNEHDRIS